MDYKKTERFQHGDIILINLRPFLPYYTIGKVIDYSYKFYNTYANVFIQVSNKVSSDSYFEISDDFFYPDNLLLYPINIREINEANKFSKFVSKIDMAIVKAEEYLEDIIFYFDDDYTTIPNAKMIYSLSTFLCQSLSENEQKDYSHFSESNLELSIVQLKIVRELLKIKQIQPENITDLDSKSHEILTEYCSKFGLNDKIFIHMKKNEKFRSIEKMQIYKSNYFTKYLEISEKSFEKGKIVFNSCLIYDTVKDSFNKFNIIPIPLFWKYLLWNQFRNSKPGNSGSVEINSFYASAAYLNINMRKESHKILVVDYINQLLTDNKELNKAITHFDQGFKNALFLKPKEYIRSIIGCLKFFDYSYYKEYLTLFFCMNKTDNYEALQVDINGFMALNPDVKPNISSLVSELYQQNVIDFIVKLAPKVKDKVMVNFVERSMIISRVKEKQVNLFFRFFKSLFKNRGHFIEFINLLDSPNYSNNVDDFLNEYQQNISKKVAKESLPLDEDKYWHIIENVNANKESEEDYYDGLVNILSEFDAATILQFGIRTMVLERMAQSADLWRAAHILKSGCSDDAFEGFKRWLIIQGKDVFESAIQNPDSLSQYDFNDDWDYEFEKLADVHVEAFENKFLREAEEYISYSKVGKYAKSKILDMEDKHFEDAILKKKCPKLFEKYISNRVSE